MIECRVLLVFYLSLSISCSSPTRKMALVYSPCLQPFAHPSTGEGVLVIVTNIEATSAGVSD